MKNIVIVVLALCCYALSLDAQVQYKQNFLLAFSKQPDIKDCKAAYSFMCCKDDICATFNATKATLAKAFEELNAMQLSLNSSMMPSSVPMMNAEDAKKLSEQLEKMTEEEKQQWALQNAKNYMPSTTVHANKDMDNQPVTDAVKCVTDQQAKDIQNINASTDYRTQLSTIEKKYESKKEEAVNKFQSVTGTTYNPSSPVPYLTGESSDVENARFDKAIEEYKKTVLPIYNSEMKEKLNNVLQAEQGLVRTYTQVEEKIALTNYGDDAQEPTNKMHLITTHMSVLQNVRMNIDIFEEVLSDYASQYAALMKIKSVEEATQKKN
ncbi:MAG: hypothetical protein ABSC53_01170 [Bacteroidota bacterium]